MSKAQCELRAKEMAAKLLRASADPLEVQYAIGQLMPLYEMIEEGGDAEEENKRLRAALKFACDLAEEELPNARVGTGAEVALRHIARRARETALTTGEGPP